MIEEPASSDPVDKDPIDVVDRFISRLYRGGLSVPPDGFRHWALGQLQQVLAFDAAIWGTGTLSQMKFHICSVIGLPAEFPQRLEETHAINPIVPALLKRLDRPVDMQSVLADGCFEKSEIYQRTFAPHGIERILSTGHADPKSGLYSLVSLYRFDRAQPFTAEDSARVGRVIFHLFNAASHAFFLQMSRMLTDRPTESAAAAVDRTGAFHEAMPRFFELLDLHFPDRAAQTLPFELPAEGETRVIDGLCIRSEPLDELRCVYVWTAGPLDRLTARERQIVYAVAHGLSFKQAAKRIGIAPSTVANHLYRVYRKLGVYSRTALAALVYPSAQ
ncbi:response regulator transcription factor [Nevskia ramosa]|uniref:helix-turn-helix transcriptional regulator n=1 Tax=Nevskia ramosa TaxID=64002 RepID=UPI003D0D3DFA